MENEPEHGNCWKLSEFTFQVGKDLASVRALRCLYLHVLNFKWHPENRENVGKY